MLGRHFARIGGALEDDDHVTKDIFIGGGGQDYGTQQFLNIGYANRHGLIAGATGTGKTVTLQILAEGFSAAGVPVFLSDVKGDLSGLAVAGSDTHKLHGPFMERAAKIGFDDFTYAAFPVAFWDMFGKQGHPVRTTISEMGPLLLGQLLGLSEAQEGILNIAFRVADEDGLPLLDLKDLQSLLVWVGENASTLALRYGNVSAASVGTIQRRLLVLENQGAADLFGEPALALGDLMRTDTDGRGFINILAADQLMSSPKLYATFLLWLLSELFEELPEVGDPDKPKLVFFFDEAHLLYDDAPKALIDKVEQVARLIRSKGVGVYFITQNPADVPDDILGQLGNRIQHALRAFTAKDRKELRLAAQTYRENPRFDTEEAIREVGVGEAVTSMLQKKGVPGVVERTLIRPPSSQLGPIAPATRAALMAQSPMAGKYDTRLDRDSAYEMLKQRAEDAAKAAAQAEEDAEKADDTTPALREFNAARRYAGKGVKRSTSKHTEKSDDSFGGALASVVIKELKGTTGRRIVRGILGGLFKGR
ncbi:helicase HerA-like domain-containing protein [Roseobacter sp. GAI101]|uniref:helicase HerA-like domain-containing protein n=1 Tax=Roseobacter sp. (strain GAI101) TaxID=391589 RepID=UPI0001871CFE|nr:ATPase [Roseobacter sp. GAI101]